MAFIRPLGVEHHLKGGFSCAEFFWSNTAYLINTARGTIVDEKALIEALRD
jgi:hypothetical protein